MQGAPKASSITRVKRPSPETRQNSIGKEGPVGSKSAMIERSPRSQIIEPQARTDILNLRPPLRYRAFAQNINEWGLSPQGLSLSLVLTTIPRHPT